MARGCTQEVAHRLAACWNACEGITETNLAKLTLKFDGKVLIGLLSEVTATRDERDELLAALEELISSAPNEPGHGMLDLVVTGEDLIAARAAIAKAKAGAQ
jgi:hypothetical protein